MLVIQNNRECWNWSREITGGQESKRISRNMFKNVLSANKIKSNIKRNQENYTYSRYYKDHRKKSVLI